MRPFLGLRTNSPKTACEVISEICLLGLKRLVLVLIGV